MEPRSLDTKKQKVNEKAKQIQLAILCTIKRDVRKTMKHRDML